MWVRHGVLITRPSHTDGRDSDPTGPKAALAAMLLQPRNAESIIERTGLTAEGDATTLDHLASVLDTFDPHSTWPPLYVKDAVIALFADELRPGVCPRRQWTNCLDQIVAGGSQRVVSIACAPDQRSFFELRKPYS